MKKLAFFFNTFAKSLSTPTYYVDILRSKLSFSFKYFFFLTLLLTIITAFKIAVPLAMFDLGAAANKFVSAYPANLIVVLQKGRLGINQPLPYVIPVPKEWQDSSSSSPMMQNFIVFDSDKNIQSPQDFYKYNTAILLTETSIYTVQNNESPSIRVYPLPSDKDVILSSSVVNKAKDAFLSRPFIKNKMYVPVIVLFLFIFMVPVVYLFRLLTAALFSIVTYFIVRFLKVQLVHGYTFSFSKIFQVSLHTLTLPIVLAYLTSFVLAVSPIHGLLYFGVYFVFTIFILIQITTAKYPKNKPLVTS